AVEAQFSRCDILINNAGIYPIQMFDEMTFADWRRLMAINLDAQFLTIKAFASGMRQRRWGRIVNMASDTFLSNLTGFAHYIASKGGVIGLTRALASEFGEDGVTVNAIAPGDEFEAAAGHQSIKRGLMPEDLVGTLSFLTSDDAAFITGQTLYVNG